MNRLLHRIAYLFTVLFVSLALSAAAKPPPAPDDVDGLAGLRSLALKGDQSAKPKLLSLLESSNPSDVATALHGLAQLDAVDAIPQIERVAQEHLYPYTRLEAAATKIRLLSEQDALRCNSEQDKVDARIRRFRNEMGGSFSGLSDRVRTFYRDRKPGEVYPFDIYLIRQLADMSYHGKLGLYDTPKRLEGLDFSVDMGSRLKVKYRLLPQSVRIRKKVTELSNIHILGIEEDLLLQLLVDEGKPAVAPIVARIKEMNADRSKQTDVAFCAMFRALHGIGDRESAGAIAPFIKDRDNRIASYASDVYRYVQKGERCLFAVGY